MKLLSNHIWVMSILLASGLAIGVFATLHRSTSITPAYTPDPKTLAIIAAGNPFAEPTPPESWLKPELINKAGDQSPGNILLRSKNEPVIAKDGDTWKITFKP